MFNNMAAVMTAKNTTNLNIKLFLKDKTSCKMIYKKKKRQMNSKFSI